MEKIEKLVNLDSTPKEFDLRAARESVLGVFKGSRVTLGYSQHLTSHEETRVHRMPLSVKKEM